MAKAHETVGGRTVEIESIKKKIVRGGLIAT